MFGFPNTKQPNHMFGFPSSNTGVTPIGQIFDSGAWSGWTSVGTATWTPSGNDLLVSGGSAGVYTARYQYDGWTTCLEKHKIIFNFQITTTPSASTSGIAIGIRSVNTITKISYLAVLNCSNTGSSGNVTIQVANNAGATTFTSIKNTTTLGAVALNDEIEMTVIKNYMTVTVITSNITQKRTSSVTFTDFLSNPSSANQWHNTGRGCMYAFGGTYTVHKVNYSTPTEKNINCLCVGDSIAVGFFSNTEEQTWFNRLFYKSNKINVRYGGSSDKTAELLLRVPEILLINPKYVVLMIGTNDLRSAIALATIKANYLSFYNSLNNAGIQVVCCYVPPLSSQDATTINTWITGTLKPFRIVEDTYFAMVDTNANPEASLFNSDLVHFNPSGAIIAARAIKNKTPFIF